MLHEEKRDSGTGRGCSKPGGTAVLSFVCAQVMHEQTKEVTVSCSLGHQTLWKSAWVSFQTPRWPAKGVTWSSLMRSSRNPPLLGTTIWSTPSELQHVTRGTPARCVTQNCGSLDMPCKKKPSHCWKHHAMHLISIAGTMAPPTRYYMHPCVVFCRLMGCHTKRSITNAKVAPTDVTLMLLGCIVCILIIIDMLFATKGTEQLLTNSWGLRISTLIHRLMKDRTAR